MNQAVFLHRRKRLLEQLNDGIAILFSSPKYPRSGDSYYTYRVDSFFYYLTGFTEQNAIAIFAPGTEAPYRLFVSGKDKLRELWEGKTFSVEEVKEKFSPDICLDVKNFEEEFKKLSIKSNSIYYLMNERKDYDEKIIKLMQLRSSGYRGEETIHALWNLVPILGEMRKVKDEEELKLLRLNAENSAKSHVQAMAQVQPGMYEYEIAAILGQNFYRRGAQCLAYDSIVASGNNANVLHYTENSSVLKDGDLLLVDAGGERDFYASDITRTYPVNGTFSPAQKIVYSLVLKAQKAVIGEVKPGIEYVSLHKKAVDVLVDGLLDVGILKGKKNEIIEKKTYLKFYPHGTGHWLGLDVHDRGNYYTKEKKSVLLEPGQVFTVEPGLYFRKDDESVPKEYRGIGVRIEDDIVVTKTGYENISAAVPKEIEEIESLVGTQKEG